MNKTKIMNIRLIITAIIFVLLSRGGYLNAQVTIGSNAISSKGALLDIKESADETTEKGLLLPRVALQAEKSLMPALTAAGAANVDSMAYHTGLTVYNMTTNEYFCPGVYTWTGTRWEEVYHISGNVIKGDAESNSFIVPPLTGIDIPVKKAYDAWKNYKSPRSALYPFQTNGAKDLSTLSPGKLGAILVWQDVPYMIQNASETDNTLYIINETTGARESAVIGTGENAIIRVLPRLSKCFNKSGNAVIAFTIDGEIYWSWHIWFTDYDPNTGVNPTVEGSYDVTNGKIYRHNNSFPGGDYVFMDRDLGALGTTPGDDASIGLVYQWGRKDPFPGASSFTKKGREDFRPIYDAINGSTPLVFNVNGIESMSPPLGMSMPIILDAAIQNPKWLLYGGTGDWYTGVRYDEDLPGTTNTAVMWQARGYQNGSLWDEDGKKTVFDPCPKGWRVPILQCEVIPWFSQEARFAGGESFAPNPVTTLSLPATAWNNGWDFDESGLNNGYNIGGYYPASGYIDYGQLYDVGTMSYHHTGTPQAGGVYTSGFKTSKTSFYFKTNIGRSDAAAVRCVKETK